ncbi:MAG TPA: hypothetical protein EYO02_12995 [Rhodospirillales bacterium]|nr:hypothetical protein [Rhodospirillales bacterium]
MNDFPLTGYTPERWVFDISSFCWISFLSLLEVDTPLPYSTSEPAVIVSFRDHDLLLKIKIFGFCIASESKVDEFTSGR